MASSEMDAEALVHSDDPSHPANHICTLCAKFYNLGWVRSSPGSGDVGEEVIRVTANKGITPGDWYWRRNKYTP